MKRNSHLQEHLDYDVVQTNNPEFNKATVRINVYRQHRQTIQVIKGHEAPYGVCVLS